ncbi:hypothetical protein MMC12_007031 [Toensbergia leucococca]|nr:hypothetical protein [Toensbergia leucococca]
MADTISIEQTNKVRIAIGLKPLPVPGGGPSFKPSKDDESSSEEDQGSTLESRQAQGYDNWKKLQDEADAKVQREAKNDAIKKARDLARRFAKIEGKGLGEADDVTDLDTKTWLLQQKKRQKKLEREKFRKLQKELEERENVADHTAEDLAGVKVGHELKDFEEGGEQVLTLKDTTIDENEEEGDELENLDLKEQEKLNERLELKKKKPVYNPNDVDEVGGTSLLQHYDETIDGKKRKRFTLDGQGTTAEEREGMRKMVGEKFKALPISLDILKDNATSDYTEILDLKTRKPKKKKAKSTRQKTTDEDDIFPTAEPSGGLNLGGNGDVMDIDIGTTDSAVATPRIQMGSSSFVDDDDLQASLATQRRAALKKRKKTKPEDIARQIREEEALSTPGTEQQTVNGHNDTDLDEGGLIIDETSEFVANLQRPTIMNKSRRESSKPAGGSTSQGSPSQTATDNIDIDMDRSYNDVEDEEDLEPRIKRESSNPATPGLTVTGLEDEATLNNGIGATLTMLSQRGLIKTAANGDINALHRERQKFLAEKQKREADAERKARLQRERDRASGKLDRMSARDREDYARWENKQRDQQESKQMADIFNREYKPDVQLKYVDEFGRSMNQQEAFKHLSHQFHGKGSGKQKTEKHLKKIEDDKRREAMSTLDSSQATGMNNAMGTTARKNRQAGVRLA